MPGPASPLPFDSAPFTTDIGNFTFSGATADGRFARVAGEQLANPLFSIGNNKVTSASTALTLDTTLHPLGTVLVMNNASAGIITIPADDDYDFPILGKLPVLRFGSQLTFVGDTGVTLYKPGGNRDNVNGDTAWVFLIKIDVDTWTIAGDTSQT